MDIEHVFSSSTSTGFIFKHTQKRHLEEKEIQLFVDLPEFKTKPEEEGKQSPHLAYVLKSLPSDLYRLHVLSDTEVAVIFTDSWREKGFDRRLEGEEVEVRIHPYDENADVILQRNLKAAFRDMTKSFTAMKREFKKVRFKQEIKRHTRKKVYVKSTTVPTENNKRAPS